MDKIVQDEIKELGYEKMIDKTHENYVSQWLRWFEGKTKWHDYFIYNGQKRKKFTMKTLNIASQSCGDLSDFFFNEKLDITIDRKKANKAIHDCLMQNNFLYNANSLMQYVEALGTGAIVPYLDKGKLRINFIKAPNIVILSTKENVPTEVLFWSKEKIKDDEIYYFNIHLLDQNDNYVILNKKYKSDGVSKEEIPLEKSIAEIHTNSPQPRFGILTTSIVNNLDVNSPYGISVYANATDNILTIDRVFDSLDNEIALGRKRVFVRTNPSKFNTDEDGNITPVFDANDTAYYKYPGDSNDSGDPIKELGSDLRVDQITQALQSQLNLYTAKVGLGHNFYKFKNGETYVNTDNVMSANSDVYRKIKKQENIITNCLVNVIYAIAELLNLGTNFEISIDYDDTIIEDEDKIRTRAMQEYNSGLISKAQYYRDTRKLDDKTAIEFMNKMNEEISEGTITEGEEENYQE